MPKRKTTEDLLPGSDDLLSGSDYDEAPSSRKPSRPASSAAPTRKVGGAPSASKPSATKTATAPARRPAPAPPQVDDDSDDMSQGTQSSEAGPDFAAMLQTMHQQMAAKQKRDDQRVQKQRAASNEQAYQNFFQQLTDLYEKSGAKLAKEVQDAEQCVKKKKLAAQKEQALFEADIQKLEQDIKEAHRNIGDGQRRMENSLDAFKSGGTRVVKDHGDQCNTVVKELKRDVNALIDAPHPFGDVMKELNKVSAKLAQGLPAGVTAA